MSTNPCTTTANLKMHFLTCLISFQKCNIFGLIAEKKSLVKGITYVIFQLASLKWTSFTLKLAFRMPSLDAIGRTPMNGGGASNEKREFTNLHHLKVIKLLHSKMKYLKHITFLCLCLALNTCRTTIRVLDMKKTPFC